MSLGAQGRLARLCLVFGLALPGFAPGAADAQEGEAKPPFYGSDSEEDEGTTAFFGSITSSNFYFSESGRQTLIGAGPNVTQNASPTSRLFTELRLQLQADHISGEEWDFKADVRGRKLIDRCEPRVSGGVVIEGCLPSQSGTFGGDERDVREFYLRYRGATYDITAGRQFMTEVAAIKFDGVRLEQNTNPKLNYFGFAGLYPTRGSRDVKSDYPTVFSKPGDPDSAKVGVLPVVAGAGGSYVRGKMYGSIGVAGILPRAKEIETNLDERTRILLSSNGYWSQSEKTDIYHYLVIDAAGAAGAGISNVSLGVNHRPTNAVNLFAHVNRVDTETLNVQAQVRLDPLDGNVLSADNIQNNWYVSRVAQESARLGASSSFSQNRFQLTATGALRRRPELRLRRNGYADPANPAQALVLPLAQAYDVTLQMVDRKSFQRFRIAGSVTRSAGYKGENLDRSKSTMARVQGTRDLLHGKGEFELNLSYLKSDDQDLTDSCPLGSVDTLSCYGTARSTIIGAGGMIFYRPKKNWFAMAMVSIASQSLITADAASAPANQPSVIMLTGFARLAYRF